MGFLLCLGILATRKQVYEFLDAYLVGYLVLLQLILDVSFNCFFVCYGWAHTKARALWLPAQILSCTLQAD